MAQIFNGQRVRGVRVLDEGATLFNMMQVRGVRVADDGVLFDGGQQTIGVDVLDQDRAIWNEQLVMGVVVITDDRALYNGMEIFPAWALTGSLGAGVNYEQAYAYVSQNSAGIGPSAALTGIENDGASAWNYAVSGTGAEVQKVPAGFAFANRKSMTSGTVAPVTTGGAFMVMEFTANSQGAASSIIIDTTPSTYMALRNFDGSLQYGYHTGTAATWTTIAPAVYGQRTVLGVEIDDDAKTVRAYASGGEILALGGRTFEDRTFTATRLGVGFDGIIHRAVVVTRPTGQAWTVPFSEVLEDFNGAPVGVPKVTEPVVLNMARGQSLSAGPSPTTTAPNGETWQ